MTHTKTALVGDASGDVRTAFREVLSPLGFLTIESEDGFHLLDRLRKMSPSLIVVDLDLRGLDGTEILHFVRRNEDWMDIPVLVTSSRADDATRRLVRQSGGTALLAKPFARETLRDVVRALLILDRERRSAEPDPGGRITPAPRA